jgi:hypothetical protein
MFSAKTQLAVVVHIAQQVPGGRDGKLETKLPWRVIWEEAKNNKLENVDRKNGLERTVGEVVGVQSLVLVDTFSTASEGYLLSQPDLQVLLDYNLRKNS